jgi:Mg2+-importing ATPase
VCALALAAPYAGPVSRLFGFTPLTAAELAAVAGLVVAYLAVTEAAKRAFFRRRRGRGMRA